MADQTPVIKSTGMAIPQMYTDGVAQVHVVGDMVKIELFTHIPTSPSQIEPVITGRVIMPLTAYLQMFEIMKDMNGKLIANGTIEEK